MKIIHTSDWHLCENHKYGGRERLANIIDNVYDIINYAVDNDVTSIYVCGDVFDHYNPNQKLFDILTKAILYSKRNGVRMRLISGDHDTNGKYNSLSALSKILNEYDDGDIVKVCYDDYFVEEYNDVKIVCMPFCSDLEKIKELSKLRDEKKFNFLFSHFAVNGVRLPNGSRFNDADKLNSSHLMGWDYVGLGDFHNNTKYLNNIHYSGSIIRINASEKNLDRFFNLVTVDYMVTIDKVLLYDSEIISIDIKTQSDFRQIISALNKRKIKAINGKRISDAIIILYVNKSAMNKQLLITLINLLHDNNSKNIDVRVQNNDSKDSDDDGGSSKSEKVDDVVNDADFSSVVDFIEKWKKFCDGINVDKNVIDYGINLLNKQ